jgi:hypothetical protein
LFYSSVRKTPLMKKLSKRTLARASANSTRHTLLAENLVLDEESKNVFALLHQEFIDRLNPTDGIEVCLVEDLASTVWRQRRLVAIETHLFKEAAAKRPEQTYLGRIGGAFSDLCRTPDMHLLDRYESRLHRMFQRTLKNLELLRQIEHTDPSTGELTQLPAEVTGIPDADPATPELPNEPSSAQPPIESATSPTTSTTNNAEDLNIKGGADFSLLPTGPEVLPQHSPQAPPQQASEVPPTPPTNQIHVIPNEPRSPEPPAESTVQPITSTHWSDRIDPITGRLRYEIDPVTGRIKKIA